MKYASIVYNDVVNSDGIALTFYCQGCTHHCKGCFNKETWDFNGGKDFGDNELKEIEYNLKNYPYDNVVLLGGEPFDNEEVCMKVVQLAKRYQKNIWCYSGYTLEQLKEKDTKLLDNIDVLIDGEFKEELKDLTLKFMGSSNQRIHFFTK